MTTSPTTHYQAMVLLRDQYLDLYGTQARRSQIIEHARDLIGHEVEHNAADAIAARIVLRAEAARRGR